MTSQSAIAALAALLALSATSARAGDRVALADCYENVIVACGQTAHPQSCALQAFERCDIAIGASPDASRLADIRRPTEGTPSNAAV